MLSSMHASRLITSRSESCIFVSGTATSAACAELSLSNQAHATAQRMLTGGAVRPLHSPPVKACGHAVKLLLGVLYLQVLDSPFSRLVDLMMELGTDQQLRIPKPLLKVSIGYHFVSEWGFFLFSHPSLFFWFCVTGCVSATRQASCSPMGFLAAPPHRIPCQTRAGLLHASNGQWCNASAQCPNLNNPPPAACCPAGRALDAQALGSQAGGVFGGQGGASGLRGCLLHTRPVWPRTGRHVCGQAPQQAAA
jgi:hypothetical protein